MYLPNFYHGLGTKGRVGFTTCNNEPIQDFGPKWHLCKKHGAVPPKRRHSAARGNFRFECARDLHLTDLVIVLFVSDNCEESLSFVFL